MLGIQKPLLGESEPQKPTTNFQIRIIMQIFKQIIIPIILFLLQIKISDLHHTKEHYRTESQGPKSQYSLDDRIRLDYPTFISNYGYLNWSNRANFCPNKFITKNCANERAQKAFDTRSKTMNFNNHFKFDAATTLKPMAHHRSFQMFLP